MRRGRIVGERDNAGGVSQEEILALAIEDTEES